MEVFAFYYFIIPNLIEIDYGLILKLSC